MAPPSSESGPPEFARRSFVKVRLLVSIADMVLGAFAQQSKLTYAFDTLPTTLAECLTGSKEYSSWIWFVVILDILVRHWRMAGG